MTTQLESLQRHSVIVADTGDLDAIQRFRPQDATTNPSLILKAAQDPRFTRIVGDIVFQACAAEDDGNGRIALLQGLGEGETG